MSIFSHVLNELKRVPTDTEEDNYDELDTEADTDSTSGNEDDDNYELPDSEDQSDTTEDQPEEPPADQEEDDNYELPSDQEEQPDDNLDSEEPQDDTEETPNESDSQPNELQELEDSIFQNLRDEEKTIRDKELLKLYISLYNDISNTLIRITNIPKIKRLLQPLEYCTNKLTDTRDILFQYIISTYKLKTYIENMTNYYEFLTILQSINRILSELKEKDDNKD